MLKLFVYFLLLNLLLADVYSQLTPNKSETVSLNGIDLYYEVYGQGEPLFLLHGWTLSSQFWKEYAKEYARNFEVFAIDLRGHGRTSPLAENGFSIQEASRDVIALMDYLNFDEINAIGLSYGGIILLQISNWYPDRLKSVVLIGASHNYSGSDNRELNEQFRFENLPQEFIDDLRKFHPGGIEQIRKLFNPELDYELRLSENDLEAMTMNTLIISGDNDVIVGVNRAFEMHKSLPQSNLWIVPNSGHVPMNDENKEEFIRITMDFLLNKQ